MSKNDYIPVKTSDEARKLASDIYESFKKGHSGVFSWYSWTDHDDTYIAKKDVMPFITGASKKPGKSLDSILSNLGDTNSPKICELRDDLLIELGRYMMGQSINEKMSFFECIIKTADLVKNQSKKNQFLIELAHEVKERYHGSSINSSEAYDFMLQSYSKVKPETSEEKKMLKKSLEVNNIAKLAEEATRAHNLAQAALAYRILGQEKKVDTSEALYTLVQDSVANAKKKQSSHIKNLLDQANERLREGDIDRAASLFRLCGADDIVKVINERTGKEEKDGGLQGIVKKEDEAD